VPDRILMIEFVLGVEPPGANMKMRYIAERAGVSPSTVSRVVSVITEVDRKLAKRVGKAIGGLDYCPKCRERGLVSGKSRILGLIVSDITNSFFPEIIHGFERIAAQYRYEILVASTWHDPKRIKRSVRRMIERRIEAVAVLTFGSEESLIDHLRVQGIRVVCVDVEPYVSTVRAVRIDYGRGIQQALRHLAALGHERIAYAAGPSYSKVASARKAAFERCMREIGLHAASDLIAAGDDTVEGGMGVFTHLAQLRNRPTAIFCSNDMTAIGVMRRANEVGVAVPQQLSVIGLDDIPLAAFMNPPLSTVRVPPAELAVLVFRALIAELEGGRDESNKPGEDVLNTYWVPRGSTAHAGST